MYIPGDQTPDRLRATDHDPRAWQFSLISTYLIILFSSLHFISLFMMMLWETLESLAKIESNNIHCSPPVPLVQNSCILRIKYRTHAPKKQYTGQYTKAVSVTSHTQKT